MNETKAKMHSVLSVVNAHAEVERLLGSEYTWAPDVSPILSVCPYSDGRLEGESSRLGLPYSRQLLYLAV